MVLRGDGVSLIHCRSRNSRSLKQGVLSPPSPPPAHYRGVRGGGRCVVPDPGVTLSQPSPAEGKGTGLGCTVSGKVDKTKKNSKKLGFCINGLNNR